MSRMFFVIVAVVALAVDLPADEPAANTIPLNGHNFTLPAGFEIELVAGPALTERPITIDFDEQGRLYIAESSGSIEKIDIQLQKKPHKILRLEDTNGDGRFDERTVFAEGMMFPEGTMWYAGSLYVAAPPSIWKLTDTNDDGVADERSEWFQGKTLTGCANDLHGPYLGPDGWIYWAKGAFAKQTYPRPDGSEWSTRASHIFRCRPDGSGIEVVMTGGMDNPVDVAFMPNGDRIVSNTFLQHPGGGKRDGLIHAVYGGVYGKDHDVIHEHPWTSPSLMPILSHLGPAAPCGLHRCESDAFGADYQDNLFTACFNMRKIVRTVLTPKGASYTSRDEDWLVSDHVDFHPTDVLEDADGSLLVVDTGGWYKLCCPTAQIEKPDVLGGIYRIRKTGSKQIEDPRGNKIAWKGLPAEKCAKLLGDPRPFVQRRAMETLAAQGDKAFAALENTLASESAVARRNAIWTTCRIDDPEARRIAARGLVDAEPDVRQAAGHAASLWRDPAGAGLLVRSQAANRRIAAEVAGRCGGREDGQAIIAMFDALPDDQQDDHELYHSMVYALIEIARRDPAVLEKSLPKNPARSPRQTQAILTALDQVKSPHLKPDVVLAALDSAEPALRETAFWIVTRHPEWGEQLVASYRDRLKELGQPSESLAEQFAKLARSPAIQQLLADTVRSGEVSNAARRTALQAMGRSGLLQVPATWRDAVAAVSTAPDDVLADGVRAARALVREKQTSETLNQALLSIADKPIDPLLRLTALSAVSPSAANLDDNTFRFLREQLRSEQSAAARSLAGEILAKAKLSKDQLLALSDELKTVGPAEADLVLKAFAQSTDDEIGHTLVAALGASKLKTSLPVGMLRERLKKFGPKVQDEAEKLYTEMDAAAGQQKEKLESLLAQLQDGDVRRGQQVFHSAKAVCSACHAIGYAGGTVGPDLTKIGLVRTERDLLESLLFPSNSFVQGYEPAVVVTQDGKSYSGLLKKIQPDQWQVITGANQSVQLSPSDVEETQLGKMSVMPAGLDQQLTTQQLADLLAYLKACR